MQHTTISSREFAADPLKVKQLVKTNIVIVTNRGAPELVILPYDRYQVFAAALPETALEALGNEAVSKIKFKAPKIKASSQYETF